MEAPKHPDFPHPFQYEERDENVFLYSDKINCSGICQCCSELSFECSCDHEHCANCDSCVYDDHNHNDYGYCDCGKDREIIKKSNRMAINLQAALQLVPKDIKLSDINIEVYVTCSDGVIEAVHHNIYYNKHISADLEAYKVAKEKYDKEYAVYYKQLEEYQNYISKQRKQKEIEELELKLKQLKEAK